MKGKGAITALYFACLVSTGYLLGCKQNTIDALTMPSQVSSIDLKQAARGIQTRIDAYITNYNPHSGILHIHDGRSGLAISVDDVNMSSFFAPGIKVRVEGVTGVSGKRVLISQVQVKIIEDGDKSKLPAPDFAATPLQLQEIAWLNQWVKISGVVRRVYWENGEIQILEMTKDGRRFFVRLMKDFGFEAKSFLNQLVTVTGVNVTEVDADAKPGDATLGVYSADFISIVKEGNDEATSVTVMSIAQLAEADLDARSGKRVKVYGTIIEKEKGSITLRDETGEAAFAISISDNIVKGDQVEVIGFLSLNEGSTELESVSIKEINDYTSIELLRSIAELFSLSRAEADAGRPINVQGQITLIKPERGFGFVEGNPSGLLFRYQADSSNSQIQPGDIVKIRGVSEAGNHSNSVRDASIELIQRSTLPDPEISEIGLLKGDSGVQWVKVDGVVQSVGLDERLGAFLFLKKADNLYRVEVDYDGDFASLKRFVNAEVEMRGISTSLLNDRGQALGFMLYTPGLEYINITRESKRGGFDSDAIEIGELLTSSETGGNNRRIHIRGIVTSETKNGDIYLQDASGAIKVSLENSADRAGVGEEIRIAGFVNNSDGLPEINFAQVQRIGKGEMPLAITLRAGRDMCAKNNAELAASEGLLDQEGIVGDMKSLIIKEGSSSFTALLPNEGIGYPRHEIGSRISVRGVCKAIMDAQFGAVPIPLGSEIYVSSPEDISLIASPAGFTFKLLQKILSILTLVLIGALVWVTLLKRRVGIQTKVISTKLTIEEKLRKQAIAANKVKSEFLANMSHEIRTPLTSILGFSELIGETGDSHIKNLASMIGRSGTRLMNTINSVLDVAQLDNDDIDLRLSALNLHTYISKTIPEFEFRAKEKGLEFLYVNSNPSDTIILANESAMERIVYNLLNNAIRFTERGRIKVSVASQEDTVTFTCVDDGIGISPDFLPYVFEPFRQESTGEGRLFEGNGLGLAIVKKLANLMEGDVRVESERGEGSKFILTFPSYKKNENGSAKSKIVAEGEVQVHA